MTCGNLPVVVRHVRPRGPGELSPILGAVPVNLSMFVLNCVLTAGGLNWSGPLLGAPVSESAGVKQPLYRFNQCVDRQQFS